MFNKTNTKKILIVEDAEINQIILRQILSDDYEIDQAYDGLEAIEKLFSTDYKPNLILLDIVMPNMNGSEVFKVLKSTQGYDNIPIILMTADEEELLDLVEDDSGYISKPFNPEVVKQKIVSLIK